jgi:hypothetical protein
MGYMSHSEHFSVLRNCNQRRIFIAHDERRGVLRKLWTDWHAELSMLADVQVAVKDGELRIDGVITATFGKS